MDSAEAPKGAIMLPRGSENTVVLPCEPEHFKDFISNLLGRPQTIRKLFDKNFEINKDDIINICHLIDQRLKSQNNSTLISTRITIGYNDNSTVAMNSLDDFQSYGEIRPLVSKSAQISLIYLIHFQNREAPEKQEIEINFDSQARDFVFRSIGAFPGT